jgi:nucleotidyltransferase substrate binding protein (TIGR01987 family)
MQEDIRWKQRFANYKKAISQLTEFVQQEKLNKFEVQGLIQCFEYTFELGWKTMKDYLEQQGYDVRSPRNAIQTAYQADLIAEGHTWVDALEKRNLMVHTYHEQLAKEAEQLIRAKYYPVLQELFVRLQEEL